MGPGSRPSGLTYSGPISPRSSLPSAGACCSSPISRKSSLFAPMPWWGVHPHRLTSQPSQQDYLATGRGAVDSDRSPWNASVGRSQARARASRADPAPGSRQKLGHSLLDVRGLQSRQASLAQVHSEARTEPILEDYAPISGLRGRADPRLMSLEPASEEGHPRSRRSAHRSCFPCASHQACGRRRHGSAR